MGGYNSFFNEYVIKLNTLWDKLDKHLTELKNGSIYGLNLDIVFKWPLQLINPELIQVSNFFFLQATSTEGNQSY